MKIYTAPEYSMGTKIAAVGLIICMSFFVISCKKMASKAEPETALKAQTIINPLLLSSDEDALSDACLKVIKLAPNTDYMLACEGYILIAKQKNRKALEKFDKAIECNPDLPLAYHWRCRARAMMRQKGALNDCDRALEMDEDKSFGFTNRCVAKIYDRDTVYQEVYKDCNRGIKLKPVNPLGFFAMSYAYVKTHEYVKALEQVNSALELSPSNSKFFLQRAIILMNLEQFDEAIRDCDNCISLKPNSPGGYLCRANVFIYRGDNEQACEALKKARESGRADLDKLILEHCEK